MSVSEMPCGHADHVKSRRANTWLGDRGLRGSRTTRANKASHSVTTSGAAIDAEPAPRRTREREHAATLTCEIAGTSAAQSGTGKYAAQEAKRPHHVRTTFIVPSARDARGMPCDTKQQLRRVDLCKLHRLVSESEPEMAFRTTTTTPSMDSDENRFQFFQWVLGKRYSPFCFSLCLSL